MEILDCIVIGAGPAGLTSSIYLKRASKNIILLEKGAPGGQVIKTNIVDNYPGLYHIEGTQLATNMFNQAVSLGVDYQYGEVKKIERQEKFYKITTDKSEYFSKKVIIATGRAPKMLGLPDEKELVGHGISYCATCDGYLYKDKIVGVVGGGNSALEEALYLGNICKKVYVFNRSKNMRADSILQKQLLKTKNIELIEDAVVTSTIKENNKLVQVIVNDDKKYDIACLFIFIGQVPTHFMVENLKMDSDYIVVDNKMATNLPGIYACGDIIKKDFYQISIAVGEGAVAALNVIKELKNENNN